MKRWFSESVFNRKRKSQKMKTSANPLLNVCEGWIFKERKPQDNVQFPSFSVVYQVELQLFGIHIDFKFRKMIMWAHILLKMALLLLLFLVVLPKFILIITFTLIYLFDLQCMHIVLGLPLTFIMLCEDFYLFPKFLWKIGICTFIFRVNEWAVHLGSVFKEFMLWFDKSDCQ